MDSLDDHSLAFLEPVRNAGGLRRQLAEGHPALPGDILIIDHIQVAALLIGEDRGARHGDDQPRLDGFKKDGDELVGRLNALPGFGTQKSKIFAALLGKQLGVHPDGWKEATTPYGDVDAFLSVADITNPETLEKVRANKRALKAKARAKG